MPLATADEHHPPHQRRSSPPTPFATALKLAGRDDRVHRAAGRSRGRPAARRRRRAGRARRRSGITCCTRDGIDFDAEFRAAGSALRSLVRDDAQICGLARRERVGSTDAAARLLSPAQRPQRLNEARLSIRDLPSTDADGPSGVAAAGTARRRSACSRPPELLAKLPSAAPISVLRISRLALEWQEAKHANGETRRWRDNTFTSGSFADLDALILEHVTADWQPARARRRRGDERRLRLSGQRLIVLWRCRELAATRTASNCAATPAHGARWNSVRSARTLSN